MTEIVEQFYTSEATARRDLESLALQGKVQRVHGGVIAIEQAPPELPILERENEQPDEAGVMQYVDLDGGWGEDILHRRLDYFKAKSPERFQIFGGVDWSQWQSRGDGFP